jgi:OOP family OmpA-OmpF porin
MMSPLKYFIVFILIAAGWVLPAQAIEIITRTDISKGIVVQADLIKRADNAIILFDSSLSMGKTFKDTGRTRYEIAIEALKERNAFLPDLGYNFGLFLYTPWKEIYPVQPYDREKFAQAVESLPDKPSGPTLTSQGLSRLGGILENLQGKTAVFIFTDGYYAKMAGSRKPATIAAELSKKYNVCFYLISTADDYHSIQLFKKAQDFSFCSRVIPFDAFVGKSVYNSEALFTVKATKKIVTTADTKVVGIKTNPFYFEFDRSDLSEEAKIRLGLVAAYLKRQPSAYAVLGGHTDNSGPQTYNLFMSYKRTMAVKAFLINAYNIDSSRIAGFWYGQENPAAPNTTREGRAMNRRVEIAIGGM